MQILLTNDDGVHSPGIKALAKALQSLGTVTVVAPATEQSGVSHALTFRTPLFVREINWGNGMKVWAVDGTPADCTRIGVLNLCEQRPDIVVSGTNLGLNIGCNVIYSGTVAGAEEGATLGIDSFAVSLEYDEMPPWEKASALITQVIRQITEAKITSDRADLININVPVSACYSKQPAEVCVVPIDQTPLAEAYTSRQDPYGLPYYWLTGRVNPNDPSHLTDRTMLKKGFVTVTPLEYNRTNRTAIEKLELAFVEPDDGGPNLPEPGDLPDPIVRGLVTRLPDSVLDATEEMPEPENRADNLPQTHRDHNANYNASPKPPRNGAKGSNENPSSYSEGT